MDILAKYNFNKLTTYVIFYSNKNYYLYNVISTSIYMICIIDQNMPKLYCDTDYGYKCYWGIIPEIQLDLIDVFIDNFKEVNVFIYKIIIKHNRLLKIENIIYGDH